MKALSALAGKDLVWSSDVIAAYQKDQHHYYLYDGTEHCGTGYAEWDRGRVATFDVWFLEGHYKVNANLLDPTLPTVAWQDGGQKSIVGFTRTKQDSFTAFGVMSTAAGRTLQWAPTHNFGYEHVVVAPDGTRVVTISGAVRLHLGGNAGHMLIAAQEATDPELPGLVAFAFAMAQVQVNRLYEQAPPALFRI